MTQWKGENTEKHELQHQGHPHLPGVSKAFHGKDDEDELLWGRLRQTRLQEEEKEGGGGRLRD